MKFIRRTDSSGNSISGRPLGDDGAEVIVSNESNNAIRINTRTAKPKSSSRNIARWVYGAGGSEVIYSPTEVGQGHDEGDGFEETESEQIEKIRQLVFQSGLVVVSGLLGAGKAIRKFILKDGTVIEVRTDGSSGFGTNVGLSQSVPMSSLSLASLAASVAVITSNGDQIMNRSLGGIPREEARKELQDKVNERLESAARKGEPVREQISRDLVIHHDSSGSIILTHSDGTVITVSPDLTAEVLPQGSRNDLVIIDPVGEVAVQVGSTTISTNQNAIVVENSTGKSVAEVTGHQAIQTLTDGTQIIQRHDGITEIKNGNGDTVNPTQIIASIPTPDTIFANC